MIDCKNCLHYAVCGYALNSKTIYECYFFTDKSRIIELPCKVGDKLYMLNRDKSKVQEMIFESPDIRCHCILDDEFDCCLPVCRFFEHGICAYRFKNDFSEIGKTVFLTCEEAERALSVKGA